MILPLIGQGCVVTHRGQQVIGTVRKAGLNHDGEYRIQVFCNAVWLEADFPAEQVRLQAFVFADGEVYNAEEAFLKKYSSAEIVAMSKPPARKIETAVVAAQKHEAAVARTAPRAPLRRADPPQPASPTPGSSRHPVRRPVRGRP